MHTFEGATELIVSSSKVLAHLDCTVIQPRNYRGLASIKLAQYETFADRIRHYIILDILQ